ncbi:MAG: CDP-alcohol phosphatidyltransferase family protein [Promethearchaeota archaeon]|jgi:CDP-diacylglycerol--serine O-phosphatidyltransferase
MSSFTIPKLLKLKDYITLIGTTLGIIALICACLGSRELISLGFFLISITLGTDLIDGYIARKTKTVNELGKELDSLSDSLTFGIVPGILTFQAFKTNTLFDLILIIGVICFVFGAILRLARFNISEVPGYTGLPTPISALILITYFYFNYFFAFGMGGNSYPFPPITSYLIPVFMVFIAWFNITSYIRFHEKDKVIYVTFIILAPLCPISGIIGILNPNFYLSMIMSVFFLTSFILILIIITRGFFLHIMRKKS